MRPNNPYAGLDPRGCSYNAQAWEYAAEVTHFRRLLFVRTVVPVMRWLGIR